MNVGINEWYLDLKLSHGCSLSHVGPFLFCCFLSQEVRTFAENDHRGYLLMATFSNGVLVQWPQKICCACHGCDALVYLS